MALCVFYLLTKSYRVFDLSVCATVYGQLAGLMCVAVVAISWTKHCQYIVAYTKLHQIMYSKYCGNFNSCPCPCMYHIIQQKRTKYCDFFVHAFCTRILYTLSTVKLFRMKW